MATLILLAIAGFMNAVMDTVADKYDSSIFSRLDEQYWRKSMSWLNKYEPLSDANGYKLIRRKVLGVVVPVMFTDAWHLAKSIMLSSITVAIVLYEPMFDKILSKFEFHNALSYGLDFIVLRAMFGAGFMLGYDLIFPKE